MKCCVYRFNKGTLITNNKYSDWLLSLNVFLSLFFIIETLHYSISEIHMCRVYFHQDTMGKSNQKIGKTHNYPSVQQCYSTSHKGIGGHKKQEKISKSKTTTLAYFDNLKKKQQDQGSKNWCYTESFMSLTISNSELLHSASKILNF